MKNLSLNVELSQSIIYLLLPPISHSELDFYIVMLLKHGSRLGGDHMVVGFTTTYAISAYHR